MSNTIHKSVWFSQTARRKDICKSDYVELKKFIESFQNKYQELQDKQKALDEEVNAFHEVREESTKILKDLGDSVTLQRVLHGHIDLDDFLFVMNKVSLVKDDENKLEVK